MRKKIIIIFSIAILSGAFIFLIHNIVQENIKDIQSNLRQKLFSDLKPINLKNCKMKRFGSANDGGYVMCENLLNKVQSAYSYGIGGNDDWGCDISKHYHLLVHQYDCFNTDQPPCPEGKFVFHTECIGDKYKKENHRIFDNLANQIFKNNDKDKRLVVKMDVEKAEWDSILVTPDAILNNIDQLVVEFHICIDCKADFHEIDLEKYIQVIQKLKKTFYIVNVHFNNYSCFKGFEPFLGTVFEVLFVNKRIGLMNKNESKRISPNPLDVPNSPERKDCQAGW